MADVDPRPTAPGTPPAEAGLADPRDRHTPRCGIGGLNGIMLRQDGDQHHHVQHRRIEAVDDEAPARLQRTGEQGGDHHAGQVRHGDLGQDHRQLELGRIGQKPVAVGHHQPGHGQLTGDGDRDGRRRHGGQSIGGEPVCGFLAVRRKPLGIVRHEGRREGPLSEHAPEQIRKRQRRIIGVRRDSLTGTQFGGNHQIARQPHEPADQGQAGKDRRRAQQALALGRRFGGGGRFSHRVLVGCVGSGVNLADRL